MNMTKKRVAELEGAQLDAMVAVAEGVTVRARPDGSYQGKGNSFVPWYSLPHYSREWSKGGLIIEREKIGAHWSYSSAYDSGCWVCMVPRGDYATTYVGPTPLIAAMRAFVASKLGDEVEVPECS